MRNIGTNKLWSMYRKEEKKQLCGDTVCCIMCKIGTNKLWSLYSMKEKKGKRNCVVTQFAASCASGVREYHRKRATVIV